MRNTDKYPVALKEQIEIVKKKQATATELLRAVSSCSNYDSLELLDQETCNLIRSTEKEILKLQILKKIAVELEEARKNLDKAIKESGSIVASRRRVQWLEKRIELIALQPTETINKMESQSKEKSSDQEWSNTSFLTDTNLSRQRDYLKVPSSGGKYEESLLETEESFRRELSSNASLVSAPSSLSLIDRSRSKTPGTSILSYRRPASNRARDSLVSSTIVVDVSKSDLSLQRRLPWNEEDARNDLQEFNKLALDKLSQRIQDMLRRMLTFTRRSLLGSRQSQGGVNDGDIFTDQLDDNQPEEPSVIKTLLTLKSDYPEAVAFTEGDVLNAHPHRRLAYNPLPVPTAAALPTARLNRTKMYPKRPGAYCDSGGDSAVVRVVDQHNLYEETKLNLYELKNPTNKQKYGKEQTALKCQFANTHKKHFQEKTRLDDAIDVTGDANRPGWKDVKPISNILSGRKWERVKTLICVNLASERVEERRDAVRYLGLLRCGESLVFYSLKQQMACDKDEGVIYESVKSLVLLGCWDDVVLDEVLQVLLSGNHEKVADLLETMLKGKNVRCVDKKPVVFRRLVEILLRFCRDPSCGEDVAFLAACLLGKFEVIDEITVSCLWNTLVKTQNAEIAIKSLNSLVKYMNVRDEKIIPYILQHLHASRSWKTRAKAAKLLLYFGDSLHDNKDYLYEQLERKLWDDPVETVRSVAAETIVSLNLLRFATDCILKKLSSVNVKTRVQAVTSLGSLGVKDDGTIRLLLEMLQLDSSTAVRVEILKIFAILGLKNRRIIRGVREKLKVDGPLASEARRTLKILHDS